MAFDTPTLLVTTVYVTGLLGGLLLFSWARSRSGPALALVGMTFLLAALVIGVLGFIWGLPDVVGLSLADGVLALGHGLIYSSVRVFNHRPPIFLSATIGAILWLVASELDLVATSVELRAVVISLIVAGYSFLIAVELGRMGAETLPSARTAGMLAGAHGLFFLGRAAFILGWTGHPAATEFAQSWSSIITLETLTATVVLAFLLLSMTKERAEAGYERATRIDHLTGVLGRRAFVDEAERLLSDGSGGGRSMALLMFDLDDLKRINDEHGYSTGDAALRRFASLAVERLPSDSLIGRIDGEEFAALVPGADLDAACELGEAVCAAFARAEIGRRGLHVTATGGAAASTDALVALSELLSAADAALSRAHAEGGNRVSAHGIDGRLLAAMRAAAQATEQEALFKEAV